MILILENGGPSSVPVEIYNPNQFHLKDIFFWIMFGLIFGVNIFAWLFAIMARTKSWWLGGVAAFIMATPVLYFTLGFGILSVIIAVFFTIIGFIFDYFISKNYKYWQAKIPMTINGRSVNGSVGPAWWAGGTWGPGGDIFRSGGSGGSGFGGFGGGGLSGGGGSNSSW